MRKRERIVEEKIRNQSPDRHSCSGRCKETKLLLPCIDCSDYIESYDKDYGCQNDRCDGNQAWNSYISEPSTRRLEERREWHKGWAHDVDEKDRKATSKYHNSSSATSYVRSNRLETDIRTGYSPSDLKAGILSRSWQDESTILKYTNHKTYTNGYYVKGDVYRTHIDPHSDATNGQ